MLAGREQSDELDDCVIHAGAVNKRDANLIAAAPELLEALENIRWAHTEETDAQALAAIAKARGDA